MNRTQSLQAHIDFLEAQDAIRVQHIETAKAQAETWRSEYFELVGESNAEFTANQAEQARLNEVLNEYRGRILELEETVGDLRVTYEQ